MGVLAVCGYLQGLLSGIPMPGPATAPLAAFIDPPDPNVETDIPTVYVWPTNGEESRDPRNAGSMPRSTGPGTPSGQKTEIHSVDLFIVWMGSGDDPLTGSIWLGVIDAVMAALRTAYPMTADVTDPWTGTETTVADAGEKMTYKTAVSALADQAYNRYDALIQLPVTEIITA